MESEAAYAERRAREERLAALRAEHPEARRVHEDLASRYEEAILRMKLRKKTAGSPELSEKPEDRTQIWL